MILRPGLQCSCRPDRIVRFVVPACPGIPHGEVSCRTFDQATWADVRHHPIPEGAELQVRVPGLAIDGGS